MAKDLKTLISDLANFGKAASIETSVTDPTEKGPASADVPTEKLIAPLEGQSASLEDTPAVSPSEPAGAQKVEGGESAGNTPEKKDFTEPCTVESAKAAGLIESASELRSKLANFGKTIAAETAPAAPAAPAAAEATPAVPEVKVASEYVPGDYLMKVAFHLMETTTGQSLVLQALNELQGHEKAAELVKAAADESASFLRDYTMGRLQAAEQEEAQLKQAYAQQQADAYYAEVTRNATPEQLEAIEKAASEIKRMRQLFEDHAEAAAIAETGLEDAYKVAMAMEQGMPPEEAAAMAAQEGAGGEGPPSPEELQAALAVLVEQGAISPEEAEQLLAELMGGGAGGAPGMGAEGMPPEDPQKMAAIDEKLSKLASEIFS